VLVVEDEAPVALDLEQTLQAEGCVVVGPVAWLERALLHASLEPIDVALLDVNLAGSLVFPVADALAARDIPFVFLTGYDSTILPERFRQRPFCQKPYSAQRLGAVLEAATLAP
jgi:DNA-binding NtrC family response regulator